MATISTIYSGELRTIATHTFSGKEIITDAPLDNNGKAEYFSPTDLVATALGSCMLTIMGIATQNHNFNIDGTTVKTTKIMGSNPRRIVEIVLEFDFPNPSQYSEKDKKFIEVSTRECPVAKSVHPDIKQTIILNI
ncbi:MAG: osmotically inducible protein OsmC [Bacteroidetes bacterium GWA2_31_9]|nr:MAG: osmotically inducible protein OsmC [Bacteroidetes bacterium GWA2_31_9]